MNIANLYADCDADDVEGLYVSMRRFERRPDEPAKSDLGNTNYRLWPTYYNVLTVPKSTAPPTQAQLTNVAHRGWLDIRRFSNTRKMQQNAPGSAYASNSRLVVALFAVGSQSSGRDYIILASVAQDAKYRELQRHKASYQSLCGSASQIFHAEHVAYSVVIDGQVNNFLEGVRLPNDLVESRRFRAGSRIAVYGEMNNDPEGRGSVQNCCSACETNARQRNLYTRRSPGPAASQAVAGRGGPGAGGNAGRGMPPPPGPPPAGRGNGRGLGGRGMQPPPPPSGRGTGYGMPPPPPVGRSAMSALGYPPTDPTFGGGSSGMFGSKQVPSSSAVPKEKKKKRFGLF